MWYAIKIYKHILKEQKTDLQYIKMGSTFFNEAIYEYATKYRKNPEYWEKEVNNDK